MFKVMGDLTFTATVGFLHRAFHRACNFIRIENDFGLCVTGGPSNGLHERCFGAKEPFFVSIKNADKGTFRNI